MYMMMPRRSFQMTTPLTEMMNDRFFRSFFDLDHMIGSAGFRMDVTESPEAYTLEAELPGVKPDDITLSVEDNTLTIAADYNSEHKEEQYLYSERRTGHMERSVNLEGIDQEAITADYENGILKVLLPKVKPVVPAARRIAIKAAGADNAIPVQEKTE